jgi:hypothetical protein
MRELGRPVVRATFLAVLALALTGMGGLGGTREEAPARDFRATFTDVDGAHIDVGRVTTGTDTTLEGDLGRGRLRIPFDSIERITFKPSGTERDRILADVKLREGEPVTITLRSSTTFYGRVPSGAYQIRARDLRAVEFAH